MASAPLFGIEDGKDLFAGHEALLHVSQLQVVERQHVLLLFLLMKHDAMTNIKEGRREQMTPSTQRSDLK